MGSQIANQSKTAQSPPLSQLTREKLVLLAQQQMDAGLLDPGTLTPRVRIEKFCAGDANDWRRIRIKRHMFDIPPTMEHPEFLANGGYGCVVECMYRGEKVAVKKVSIPGRTNADDALRLLREVLVLQTARREKQASLCQLLDVYCNADCNGSKQIKHIYMVMPLYSPGSLEEVHVASADMFHTIASHTLEAVHWLHAHNILHRDVKRENIFYDATRNRAVLGDMGNSRQLSRAKMTGTNEVGTKCYQAPEFLSSQRYGFASDVWALAVCWYEMLCLEDGYDTLFPLSDVMDKQILAMQKSWCQLLAQSANRSKHTVWAKIAWSRVQDIEKQWNQRAYSRIFRKIFVFEQGKRPSSADLYNDPFFANSKPTFRVVQIPGLDTDDYDDARTHLFNLRTLQNPSASSKTDTMILASTSTKCPSVSSSQLVDELSSPSLFNWTRPSPGCSPMSKGKASVSPGLLSLLGGAPGMRRPVKEALAASPALASHHEVETDTPIENSGKIKKRARKELSGENECSGRKRRLC